MIPPTAGRADDCLSPPHAIRQQKRTAILLKNQTGAGFFQQWLRLPNEIGRLFSVAVYCHWYDPGLSAATVSAQLW